MSSDFSPEQKRYLEGFVSGLSASRVARSSAPAKSEPVGPDAIHLKAQDRTIAAGGKLNDQEKFKRDEHPFDAYPRLVKQAENNEPPKPQDNFRWRYYGIFYVAPTQSSYMCRMRIPNGILKHWQFAGVADLAENFGGPYAHVTTRANLQIREIEPKNAINVIEGLQDLGLCSRGSGADNIRNVTGTSTAGIDPQEILDTRRYAREWHYHILNDRSLYGLPRKFNVAFDGAGRIATLEETNDIAFQAIEVLEGHGVEPGIYFRLALGGITGHKDFARDTGVILKPNEATEVADRIVRVFIENGDRTNRNKARLKYVLDSWGFDKFLAAVEEKLGRKLLRVPAEAIAPRPTYDRFAHIGVHPQKQAGLNWIGVALKLGHLSPEQIRSLAKLAADFGDGDIRLTVWQNLLISGVADADVATVTAAIEALGLSTATSALRAGLIACTGKTGCRFAAAHTKESADEIATWCDERVPLKTPVNIHLTGCHHSCAQHYIGDIGMIGARVPINDDGDTVDGFHLLVGGGFGTEATMARELFQNVKAEDAPRTVERVLKAYLTNRASDDETFVTFAKRTDIEALRRMAEMEAV
ncbi:NirA family protein [Afipia clevelandensis]|uniref:Precorrin-3B synthase n=1 Tax=Afipia clevelandensis ATCC 49720 TaxID=883079 RepID=K8PFX4_9BRAD|nr:NirA family protein [Afipia clevelandensis]EKS40451.1 precorrin-3B synthase [Afipia clevelandensis ATCC 49720]